MMPTFEPVLLANVGKPNSHTRAAYEAAGGYAALRKVLKEMTPAATTDLVKQSNLRGRGGAGFPTGLKWTFLPKDHPGPIYMCINADESEPGTFNNRILMEDDPHQVLEGTIISCYATRASTAYIYLRFEYPLCYERLQAAIDECYAAGFLGKNILGTQFSLDIYLHRGAAAYICGEETGLIESLEGKRAWPRIKPPFPAVEGLFRKPTVVNNIETVACVTHIARRGAEWFKSIGVPADPKNPRDPGSYGPKLYCLSGHVNKPGCYEAPLGITCRQLIDEYGGGVWKGRKAKAAIPGGISMGLLDRERIRHAAGFRRARQGRLPRAGHRGRRRHRRNRADRRFPAQQLPLLPARKLRPMHAVPRGHRLDAADARPHQGRPRAAPRSRPAVGDWRLDRHHPRHDDLRPGRRRRLADQKRDPQIPRRIRGLHQAHEPNRLYGHRRRRIAAGSLGH